MNGFLLLLPFLLVRFGLLSLRDKKAVQRAAHFAPMQGRELIAYGIYQAATFGILFCSFFLRAEAEGSILFCMGLLLYAVGLVALCMAVISFSAPDESGLNTKGIYRFSRHPMYAAYFLYFAGMALLMRSLVLACMVLLFQISAHGIILAEERECIKRFGKAYQQYMKKVRRYF